MNKNSVHFSGPSFQCSCSRLVQSNKPHYEYKCQLLKTEQGFWLLEAADGYGECYEIDLLEAKYCPWCGGLLESWRKEQDK